jgi:hypothetical protein
VSDLVPRDALRGREAWRLLNSRPGWRISIQRFYVLLDQGKIPNVALHGMHNTHYTVSREALEKWAASVEAARTPRRARAAN